MNDLDFINNNVKKWRLKKNLTQQQLADRAGYVQSFITQLENNNRGFTKESLIRIAKALKIKVDILLIRG
tara:strand:+ start:756 stop:965 length:210 start_codon:yes stop_codon:yes gene_type:complete